MKLIINIDEKEYNECIERNEWDTLSLGVKLIQAVQNGIPLEEEPENSDVNGLKIAECSECNRRTWNGNCLLLDGQVKFVNFDYVPDDCPLKENKQ